MRGSGAGNEASSSARACQPRSESRFDPKPVLVWFVILTLVGDMNTALLSGLLCLTRVIRVKRDGGEGVDV